MTTEQSSVPQTRRIDRRSVLRSLGASLFINALCPYLLYRVLEPHFPAGSIVPLVYATIFPVVGLVFGYARKRTVDGVALLAILGIAAHVAVTLIVGNVAVALVIRSLDGAVIGFLLVVSALIGRPIILYVVKQLATAEGQEHSTRLGQMLGHGAKRLFSTVTLVWGAVLVLMSGVHVLLALRLPPAEFLLASPIVGVGSILALLIWTAVYLRIRARKMSGS